MSTKAANGSGSSRSKKSSRSKHSSKTKSTSSRASSQSKAASNSGEDSPTSESSGNSTNSSSSRRYTPSERLVNYVDDTEHSNTGYSSAYTNALTYTYGFPEDRQARTEMENEMMAESEARALERIDENDRWMEYEEQED
ncbi:hypothetical protein IFR05_002966 [Cadophora sp. M221]|nr:hypothetical protein IFR05_002966 [Cadophora sp. M221]